MGELRHHGAAKAAEVSDRIFEGSEDSVLRTSWGISRPCVDLCRMSCRVEVFLVPGRVRSRTNTHCVTMTRTYEGLSGGRGHGDRAREWRFRYFCLYQKSPGCPSK